MPSADPAAGSWLQNNVNTLMTGRGFLRPDL